MKTWMMRIGVVALALVMALGVVGMAAAQGPDGQPGVQWPGTRLEAARLLATTARIVEEQTGLKLRDVLPDIVKGQTLSDVLTENGADPQAIRELVKADVTDQINQAVADGQITQARADTALGNLDDALDTVFTSELPLSQTSLRDAIQQHLRNQVENSLLGVLAEMAGVEPQDVLRDALTPPSLAEIAQSYGLDGDAVITEAEARITDEINQRVADGDLTQEAADQLLADLHDRLPTRFDAPLGSAVRGWMQERMDDWMPGRGSGRFGGRGAGVSGLF